MSGGFASLCSRILQLRGCSASLAPAICRFFAVVRWLAAGGVAPLRSCKLQLRSCYDPLAPAWQLSELNTSVKGCGLTAIVPALRLLFSFHAALYAKKTVRETTELAFVKHA